MPKLSIRIYAERTLEESKYNKEVERLEEDAEEFLNNLEADNATLEVTLDDGTVIRKEKQQ